MNVQTRSRGCFLVAVVVLVAVVLAPACNPPSGRVNTPSPTPGQTIAAQTLSLPPSPSLGHIPSPSPSPSFSPSPTTPSPTATPVLGTLGDWEVATPHLEFIPQGLVANDVGYLAFGIALGAPVGGGLEGLFNMGLAFSADGLTWTNVPAAGDLSNSMAVAAAAAAGRFVVVGSRNADHGVFLSDDGLNWSFQPIKDAQDAAMTFIAAGSGGFLIAGQTTLGDASSPAAAWFSPDGSSWTRVTAPEVEKLASVVAYGDGFIALGSQRDTVTYERTTYSMWRTVDGTSWEPFGTFPDQVCCSPQALAVRDLVAVAVGAGDCDGGLIGAAWRYLPGSASWERVPHTAALDASYLWQVGVTGQGFLSVGTRGSEFSSSRIGVWTSNEGSNWALRQLLTEEGSWLSYGPVTGPAGLMVLGWSSKLPDFAASPQPTFPRSQSELKTWLLPPGGSPGPGVPDGGTAASNGCDVARAGTGLTAQYLESSITGVPVTFQTVQIDGRPARKGTDADGSVEILLIGDPLDVERIEVRGRDTETVAGSGVFALEWLWTFDDPLQQLFWDIEDGTKTHFDAQRENLSVTGDRLTGHWQYQFIVSRAN